MSRLVEALLRMSTMVLDRPDVSPPLAARAAALMSRQALEQTLRDMLEQESVGLGQVTTRAQLLVLHSFDAPAGETTAALWQMLTDACHHHPYELTPTPAEVATLVADTLTMVEHLAARDAPEDQSSSRYS